MARIAIIACGNPLRSDDGLAWQAAETLRTTLRREEAEIVCVHQLTPELAETASQADTVIFLDAAATGAPGLVSCQRVGEASASYDFSHHLSPAGVIAMSSQLYGRAPHAFLVSLAGQCFDHGQQVSKVVADALPRVVSAVQQLVRG